MEVLTDSIPSKAMSNVSERGAEYTQPSLLSRGDWLNNHKQGKMKEVSDEISAANELDTASRNAYAAKRKKEDFYDMLPLIPEEKKEGIYQRFLTDEHLKPHEVTIDDWRDDWLEKHGYFY
jgi:hypothetical protein